MAFAWESAPLAEESSSSSSSNSSAGGMAPRTQPAWSQAPVVDQKASQAPAWMSAPLAETASWGATVAAAPEQIVAGSKQAVGGMAMATQDYLAQGMRKRNYDQIQELSANELRENINQEQSGKPLSLAVPEKEKSGFRSKALATGYGELERNRVDERVTAAQNSLLNEAKDRIRNQEGGKELEKNAPDVFNKEAEALISKENLSIYDLDPSKVDSNLAWNEDSLSKVQRQAVDATAEDISRKFYDLGGEKLYQEGKEQYQRATPENQTFWQQAFSSAAQSLGQQAPLALAAFVTRNPNLVVTGFGFQEFGRAYGEGISGGLSPDQAFRYGVINGLTESLTEYLPFKALWKNDAGFTKRFINFMVREIPGENIAEITQTVNSWANGLQDDITVSDILDTMAMTTASTLISGGGQTTVAHFLDKLAQKAGKTPIKPKVTTDQTTNALTGEQVPDTTQQQVFPEKEEAQAEDELTNQLDSAFPDEGLPEDITLPEQQPDAASAPVSPVQPTPAEALPQAAPVQTAQQRQPFQKPDVYLDQKFAEKSARLKLTPEQATELAPKVDMAEKLGDVGYYRARDIMASIERAQEHNQATGEPVFYVEADYANMGGGNKAKVSNEQFDEEFFIPSADMLRQEIESIGADIVPGRVGGDEVGFVIVNATEDQIQGAMQRAAEKTYQMSVDQGMGDIPNPKYPGSKERGINLYYGITPIIPGKTASEVRKSADRQVNLNKLERNNGDGQTTGKAGIVAPEGQAGPIKAGASETGSRVPEATAKTAASEKPTVTTPKPVSAADDLLADLESGQEALPTKPAKPKLFPRKFTAKQAVDRGLIESVSDIDEFNTLLAKYRKGNQYDGQTLSELRELTKQENPVSRVIDKKSPTEYRILNREDFNEAVVQARGENGEWETQFTAKPEKGQSAKTRAEEMVRSRGVTEFSVTEQEYNSKTKRFNFKEPTNEKRQETTEEVLSNQGERLSIYPLETTAGPRFAVQLGDKPGFGDNLFKTEQQAKEYVERTQELERKNAEFRQKQSAEESERKAKQDEKERPLNKHLDSANLSPMQRGKLKSSLTAPAARRDSSTNKVYRGARYSVASEMFSDGWRPNKLETKKIKDVSRRRFNQMDEREQQAFDKRQKEAGQKTEYVIEKGNSSFEITKAEYDYLEWISANKVLSKPGEGVIVRPPRKARTALDDRREQLEQEEKAGEESRAKGIQALLDKGVKPERVAVGTKRKPAVQGGGETAVYEWQLKIDDNRYYTLSEDEAKQATQDSGALGKPQYSKQSVIQPGKRPLGMRKETVQKIADEFTDNLNLLIRTQIVPTQKEIFGEKGEKVKGGYTGDRVVLIAENLNGPSDTIKVLQHEILGHYGLRIDPDLHSNVINRIRQSRNEKSLKSIWEKVDRDYANESENIKAEEVFARVAESPMGRMSKLWLDLIKMIRDALRKVGLINDTVSKSDLQSLVYTIADSIRDRRTGELSQAMAYSKSGQAPVFFSALARAARGLKQETGTAEQFLAQLKKQPGIKAEELEWTGLEEYLTARGKDKVTKQEIVDFLDQNGVQVKEVQSPIDETIGTSDLTQWQLPGGENYREVLLTLPAKQKYGMKELPQDARVIKQSSNLYFVQIPSISKQYLGSGKTKQEAIDDALATINEDVEKTKTVETKQFRSTHFDEPNILAHIRLNDRTDSEGNRVLFVEEIQSDWHQKGRKEGYRGEPIKVEVMENIYGKEPGYAAGGLIYPTREEAEAGAQKDLVPNAPFKGNAWAELSIKRVLRMAAEEGYQSVAWTTGEQQNERYDLSKQVRSIAWSGYDSRGATKLVSIEPISGNTIELPIDDSGVVVSRAGTQFDGKPIDEVVGKDMAEKIMAERSGDLSGDGLKIGGSGMTGFYDKILPNLFKKVAGKLDKAAKVGETTIIAGREDNDEAYLDVHSIQITGEMRDAALSGQPLFSKRKSQEGVSELKGEGDVSLVETGKPVKFYYFHNKESAAKYYGKPKKDDRFGRDLEPAGQYVNVTSEKSSKENRLDLETGTKQFNNPLVLPNDNLGWKKVLSAQYGGKKGKALSQAIADDGHDGIITTEDKYISEVVDLSSFMPETDKLSETFDQPKDYTFTESDYRPEVISWAKEKWGDKVADNGKPVWQNFARWFGESVVTDEDGAPLVVYHGTGRNVGRRGELMTGDFDTFDPSFSGKSSMTGAPTGTFFFTDDPVVASSYTVQWRGDFSEKLRENANIMPVYVNLQKPLKVDAKGANWRDIQYKGEILDVNEIVNLAKESGKYDGVIIRRVVDHGVGKTHNKPSDTYIAFHPTQIKSTSNRGTFDPQDPSILYSKTKEIAKDQEPVPVAFKDWTLPNIMSGTFSNVLTKKEKLMTTARQIRRKMQDKHILWKDVQDQIGKTGGKLSDFSDAYNKFTLVEGKIGDKFKKLFDDHIQPLISDLTLSNVSIEQLGEYLYAQFAPQRNARIAEINPDMPDGGSGLTNAEAKKILDGFTVPQKKQLERLAQKVYAMQRYKLDVLVDSGRITADLRDDLLKDDRYVPLKGFADTSDMVVDTEATGRGFDQAKDVFKRAKGRKTLAADLLSTAVRDVENAVINAEKNRVGQSILKLVMDNPNENLWKVNPIKIQKAFNSRSGQVEQRVIKDYKALARDPNVFITWVKGKPYAIEFRDNPMGESALARAVKNMGVDQIPAWATYLSKLNRWLSYANTALSPEFLLTNPIRDIQTALAKAYGDYDARIAGNVLKNLPKAIRGAIGGIGESKAAKKVAGWNPAWTAYYKEYAAEGGKTDYFRTKTVDEMRKELTAELNAAAKGKKGSAIRAFRALHRTIENGNAILENMTRVSMYITLREAGYSQHKAATAAKNLTVNFNRKGESGAFINSLYLFYNASIQGAHLTLRLMKNPKVQKLMVAAGSGMIVLTQYNILMGGDDDDGEANYFKIPDYEKERNIIIMWPDGSGRYTKFPMPYGLNVPMNAAASIAHVANGRDPVEQAVWLAGSAWNSFSPVGENGWNIIAPTVLDPFVDIGFNRNFMDRNIMPEKNPFEKSPTPDSQRSYPSTSNLYKVPAEFLNEVTGGNQQKPGWVDISPESIQHLTETYTGAAGGFLNRLVTWATDPDFDSARMPFKRKFYGEKSPYTVNQRYRANKENIYYLESRYKYLTEKAGDPGGEKALAEFVKENSDGLSLLSTLKGSGKGKYRRKGMESQLKKLYEERADYRALGDKDQEIKTIEEEIRRIQSQFNTMYNDAFLDRGISEKLDFLRRTND